MEKKDNRHLPLVSIVIPMYNQKEHFLKECIESAINQTYLNTEIIISDNHSDNGASEIIAAYALLDSRIRIIKPDRFLTLIENFIFAYSQVRGEYICPLSSDDILYPKIIEEHLKPFDKYPQLSFTYSIPLYFTTEISKATWHPDKLDTGFYTLKIFLENFINRWHMTWGGILFKTSDYYKIGGFSKDYSPAADVDLIIKLTLLGRGVYCINKALSAIRIWTREEQLNRTPYEFSDLGKILDNIENAALQNKISLDVGVAKKAKKAAFSRIVFPMAYFIKFKKRDPDILEKMVAVIKENYPKGMYNFILQNRTNIIGLTFSISYLSFIKVRKWLK